MVSPCLVLNNYRPASLPPECDSGQELWTSHLQREMLCHQSKWTPHWSHAAVLVGCVTDSCEQGLVKFILPLGLVYLAEYFINQGLVSSD